MIKKLALLNGLAILAVVCNHAAGWVFTAMFWWTDQYRQVTVPNYDAVGSFSYYVLEILRHLTVFSVPAFLFVSGYFISYAARAGQSGLGWKTIWNRVKNLLIPYFIWSLVFFVVDFILGERYSLIEYLQKLLLGQATPAYYFVPLLVQLFLLAPFMAPLARTRWKLLLVVAGIVQAIVTVIRYVGLFNPSLSALTLVPPWLFISIAFFFPFGIVFGFQMKTIHPQLVRFRWVLFACAAVFAIFAIIEQEYLYRNTSLPYGATFPSISTSLWSAFIILSFLGFENLKIPFTKFFNDIGNKTYGIYLTHPLILTIVSKMTYHLFPDLLAFYLVFLLILVPLAIGLPLLAMRVYTRLPIKKSYRYVFG